MDTIKTNFYKSFNIKTDELNHKKLINTLFIDSNYKKLTETNKYAQELLDQINATTNEKKTYDFLLGYECARILTPKICTNTSYKINILLHCQDIDFCKGFIYYVDNNYDRFDIYYYIHVNYDGKINTSKKLTEIKDYFSSKKITVDSPSVYTNDWPKYFAKRVKQPFDGIVSFDYTSLSILHPKGYFLNIVPSAYNKVRVLFNAFLFRSVVVIHNPILSELLVLSQTLQTKDRIDKDYASKYPSQLKLDHVNLSQILDDSKIQNILDNIKERESQLEKVNFIELWLNFNENFIKTKSSSFDLINFDDVTETKFPDDYDDKNNN
jgi:hypothetical protein